MILMNYYIYSKISLKTEEKKNDNLYNILIYIDCKYLIVNKEFKKYSKFYWNCCFHIKNKKKKFIQIFIYKLNYWIFEISSINLYKSSFPIETISSLQKEKFILIPNFLTTYINLI